MKNTATTKQKPNPEPTPTPTPTPNWTPGPWRYEQGTKTVRACPSNYWLATMDSWDGAVNHTANARLIASAPDLYDALEALLTQLEGLGVLLPGGTEGQWSDLEGLCVAQARAALSKALGEAKGDPQC